MQPHNILHVLRAPVGGLFRHVTDLVRGQIARGHRVGIVADSLTGGDAARATFASLAPDLALGLSLTPIERAFGLRDVAAGYHVLHRVHATQADVVHGHGAKGGAFARLAFADKPFVRAYTPHGGSLLLDHTKLTGKIYLALERLLMPRGDLYLFESAYSADVFNAKIGKPSGQVRVVHNGVSAAEFDPVALAPDATDLVFLGELRPVKGIDTLIDAIALLHRGGHNVTATLVGGGPLADDLKTQVAGLGLDHFIRFMPPMPARAAMALGRVMVIPSRAESLPYVVLETAAAGKPLITTHVGGIPEIYDDLTDTLVAPGDSRVLANAIAGTIRHQAAANAVAIALRDKVISRFSADVMVDSVLAGYRQALSQANSGLPLHTELSSKLARYLVHSRRGPSVG